MGFCRILSSLFMLCILPAAFADAPNVSVVDDLGNRIQLDKPAQRIVSLAPHVTEMLFAAGAGEQVIAGVSHSDYPEAAKHIPQIGTYTNINLELLIGLKPDLVVGWQSGNGPSQIDRLKELGMPLYITNPERPEDIATNIRKLGVLSGHIEDASRAGNEFIAELTRLRKRYSHQPKITVFYQAWNTPLVTLNGEHLISHLIDLCGGSNIFEDLPALAPNVSIEAVLALDPQAIIASGMGDERPDWLDMWLAWPNLSAVKNKHLFFIPPDIVQRHSPRVLTGTRLLCEQLEQARSHRARQAKLNIH